MNNIDTLNEVESLLSGTWENHIETREQLETQFVGAEVLTGMGATNEVVKGSGNGYC